MDDKKYMVTFTLDVKEHTTEGSTEDFFSSMVTYPKIGYEGVIGIEQALLEVLIKLGDAGLIKAEMMGLGDKMKALGLTPRLSALKKQDLSA
jgi:hypothetical protein